MNITEKVAYKWFIENGFKDEEIDFNRRRSVDFIVLGEPYEVKKVYRRNILYFTEKQLKTFKKIDPTILIFQKNKLVGVYKFSNLPRKYRVEIISLESTHLIRIREETFRELEKIKKEEGHTSFDSVIKSLLRNHREVEILRGDDV